jgi:hypothetical protein
LVFVHGDGWKIFDASGALKTSGGGGASELGDLTDVTILTPQDNDNLEYNSVSGDWENVPNIRAAHEAAANPHPGYLTPAEGDAAYAPISEPIAAAHIADATDAHDASAISILDAALDFDATDVEGALAELQADAEADAAALAAHLADTTDAHDASAISILDTADDFTATDVEGALAELQSDAEADAAALAAHLADTTDAHDASAISILDAALDFDATDVEGALAELQSDAEADAAALAAHLADTTDVHDHGSLSGLVDDDHAQYVLLAGRAGGQTIIGGTAVGDLLTLRTGNIAGIGASGPVSIFSGTTTDGDTGAIVIFTADATGTNRSGGNISITCGFSTGTGPAATLSFESGNAGTVGDGGFISFISGAGGTVSGDGGPAEFFAGAAGAVGTGGAVTIISGVGGGTSGASGIVNIQTGNTTDGDTGAINIFAGVPTIGNIGVVNLQGQGGHVQLGGGTASSELRLFEPSAGGTSFVAFKAPALAGNTIYTLPTVDAAGALTSNGAGGLSWVDYLTPAEGDALFLTPAEGDAAYAPITEPIAAAHIVDAADAHDASAISILDSANDFTATDVEGALAELQADAEAHLASADDHPLYLLAAGTRALSADWDAGSFEIRSATFESDVVTGTAPFVIGSTTKVVNLNVDLLDDQSGAFYLDSANFTGTNWTDLTDTGATTLHKHDHGGQDGLADDDHTQYALLAGRSGGQILIGGTAAGDDIIIRSTSNATKGDINLADAGGHVQIGGGATASEMRLFEPSGGGASYVSFKAPALAANVDYTLPIDDGAVDEVLSTNGSGVLDWVPQGGGGISATIVDAKGDLIAATAADTVARFGVGANGTTPVADSNATLGLVYGFPAIPGYIFGLNLSNDAGDPTNDVGIAVGVATDTAFACCMQLSSALIKRLDASWVVGTNQGMLDGTESVAGTPDVSTWHHIYLIRRPDTGVVDVLASESATAPTMPTNYTQKRRIGSVFNDSGGGISAFSQLGDEFLLTVPIQVKNATVSTASELITMRTPLGVQTLARAIVGCIGAASMGDWIDFFSPDITGVAPGVGQTHLSVTNNTAAYAGCEITIRTNTSSQIKADSLNAVATVSVYSVGWLDQRI